LREEGFGRAREKAASHLGLTTPSSTDRVSLNLGIVLIRTEPLPPEAEGGRISRPRVGSLSEYTQVGCPHRLHEDVHNRTG